MREKASKCWQQCQFGEYSLKPADNTKMHNAKTSELVRMFSFTCEGTFLGGSIRMEGSHSPGGNTVTWSRNSSMPATKSFRSLALYATSWKTCECIFKDTCHFKSPVRASTICYSHNKNIVSEKGKLFLDRRWNSCLMVFVIIPMYDDVGWQPLCFYFHTSLGTTTSYKKSKAHPVTMMDTDVSS